jgi:hypothetical protein
MPAGPESRLGQLALSRLPVTIVRFSLGLSAVLCLATAGCGGSSKASSSRPRPTAETVCASIQHAAARLLGGGTHTRIVDHDRANIECLVTRKGIRAVVTAQALAQAWNQFDTIVAHQAQGFGSSQLNDPGRLPQPMVLAGANAAWIPAQRELIATNGTQSQGGSYVTVVVSGSAARGKAGLRLARAVGAAALASAPRGGAPGPAPS